jgi:hypothetical protein
MSTLVLPKGTAQALRDLTGEPRPDVALLLVLRDALAYRLEQIETELRDFETKYGMALSDVTKPSKRITLPIVLERYQEIMDEPSAFRPWLDGMIEQYPELFPAVIEDGYTLHDMRSSRKASHRGGYEIIQTTVKGKHNLPEHLLTDHLPP